MVSKDFC